LKKVQSGGRVEEVAEKKSEIDAEIEWDVIKKIGAVGYGWRC
jgi:hypothetical protein